MGWTVIDHTGERFGRLTVIERLPSRRGLAFWRCVCDCGNETATAGAWLRQGKSTSCGCTRAERLRHSREQSIGWRGDDIEYMAAHHRARSERGPASDHFCIDCGEPAKDWSYRGGCPRERISQTTNPGSAFSPDPNMYDPRCRPCHGAYDALMRRKAREEAIA